LLSSDDIPSPRITIGDEENAVVKEVKHLEEEVEEKIFGKTKGNIITLDGKIIWRNTDGYLSAEFRPEMKFFLTFSIYYTIMCIVWVVLYIKYKDQITVLNRSLMVILSLGFGECWISYMYYLDFDTSAEHSDGLYWMTIIMNVAREAVARVLVI